MKDDSNFKSQEVKMRTLLIRTMIAGLFVFLVVGCAELGVYQKKAGSGYGPPPHAPAHGYRQKHHGRDMVFNTGLGVYVVSGIADHYFQNNNYYRYRDGNWWISLDFGGPWVTIGESDIPPGLKMKKGKGHEKQKHKWK